MKTRGRRYVAPLLGVGMLAQVALVAIAQPAAADVPQPNCQQIWQRAGSGFYENNPTYIDSRDDSADWQFSTPAAQGMDGALLTTGINQLAANNSLYSVLILRHGNLVKESYLHGGAVNKAHNIHSASKSMLQALVSIAIQRGDIGSLDDRVSAYLPEYFTGATNQKKRITIRELLNMSSGLNWTEDETEYTIENKPNWAKAILQRSMWSEPGTEFNYSTGNTHVLSALLQRATGMSTCQFASQNLFSKLGITAEHWGRDPQAVYSGGYNLYLTPREMAKFGQLYLDDGWWNGQRLIAQSTIDQAKTAEFQDDETFSYAEGWWVRTVSGHQMYFDWGYGGQFLYVIPDHDIVFATTQNTGNNVTNVEINSGQFIQDYLIPAVVGAR